VNGTLPPHFPKFIEKNDYISTNPNNLTKLVEILAGMEENHFKAMYQRGRLTQKTNETDPCKLALFQFDNLTLSDVNFLNIGKEPSTIKRRENIIIIGFYHYYTNIYLVSKKPFKSESILTENFIKSMENKANIKFYPDQDIYPFQCHIPDNIKQQ
jgi:hypothetical protein